MDEIVNLQVEAPSPAADDVGALTARLLATVGARVGAARKDAALSRRALSELSGVSQRYLVQLEGGQGNVSIGLLLRLAVALDRPLPWFLGADDREPASNDLAALAAGATPDQLARARAILAPAHPARRRRVALIGLRGAGKSTLGRLAGERLDLPFFELNEAIEQASGMAVNEVIALYGQEGFRHLERRALERIAESQDALLLAVAGGIVSNPDSYDYLLGNYHTIWLRAAPEEHMSRVRAQGDERPMAGNPDAMAELRAILTAREVHYARADASIDTSGRALEESLADVVGAIARRGFLGGEGAA